MACTQLCVGTRTRQDGNASIATIVEQLTTVYISATTDDHRDFPGMMCDVRSSIVYVYILHQGLTLVFSSMAASPMQA